MRDRTGLRWHAAALAISVLSSFISDLSSSACAQESRIEWRATLAEATADAKKEGKEVLLVMRFPT